MSEISSRQTLISLIPRQVMLETATKADATSKDDNYKKKKMNDKGVALDVADEERKSKKQKKSCKSDVSLDVCVAEGALAQDRPRCDGMSRNGMGREDILRSIAAFLESSGFSKTLSVFLSEAKIEAKSREDSCINLENLFDKVIKSSQKDPLPSIEWPKEQGILLADAVDDSNAKAKDKKRKDKAASDSIEEENVVKNYLDTSPRTAENIDYDNSLKVEKKKRRKVILGENKSEEGRLNFEEVKKNIEELKELTSNCCFETCKIEKNKSEKKNKKKEANQSLEQSEFGVSQEVIVEKPCDGGDYASTSNQESVMLGRYNNIGEGCLNFEEVGKEKIIESKEPPSNPSFELGDIKKNKGEKKKKKKKDANESLEQFELGVNLEKVILEKSNEGDLSYVKRQESVNSEKIVRDLQGKVEGSKKNKKNDKIKKPGKSTSDSLPTTNSDKLVESMLDGLGKNDNDDVLGKPSFRNESIAISEENNGNVEKSTNKNRKRSSSNETSILDENINAASKSKPTKSDVAKDKKKREDHTVFTCSEPSSLNGKSKESSEVHSSIVLAKHEENPISTENQLNGDQHANGIVEKHQNEGSTRTKSMKKPKVVKSFQRIKVDDVQFEDERLRDNSYWAMDVSGSGYGAKAQEVLGQVRGRDFRHEKTKKKRGTYRGGKIDLQTHSIKFNYSDDE